MFVDPAALGAAIPSSYNISFLKTFHHVEALSKANAVYIMTSSESRPLPRFTYRTLPIAHSSYTSETSWIVLNIQLSNCLNKALLSVCNALYFCCHNYPDTCCITRFLTFRLMSCPPAKFLEIYANIFETPQLFWLQLAVHWYFWSIQLLDRETNVRIVVWMNR